mgnify:CR=1 FL=1
MAFPDKITNREYKVAGAFFTILGLLLTYGAYNELNADESLPKAVAIIFLGTSALMLLCGLLCIVTKPIRGVLVAGAVSSGGTAIACLMVLGFSSERPWILGLYVIPFAIMTAKTIMWRKRRKAIQTDEQDPSSSESPQDDQPETH